MISWKDMDERERSVWSATYGAAWMTYQYERPEAQLEDAIEMSDKAVEALRAYLKSLPS